MFEPLGTKHKQLEFDATVKHRYKPSDDLVVMQTLDEQTPSWQNRN